MKIYAKVAKLKKLCEDMFLIFDAKDFFTGKPITDPYNTTVHHINGNHNDNRPENLALSITRNHKSHHCKKTRPVDFK